MATHIKIRDKTFLKSEILRLEFQEKQEWRFKYFFMGRGLSHPKWQIVLTLKSGKRLVVDYSYHSPGPLHETYEQIARVLIS
jgi:hypothetical protein